jgi:hypothetical protein
VIAPVFFCWASPNGSARSGTGTARDIDTTGAFIHSIELAPVGARVQMDIMLPNISGGEFGTHLIGEGVVVRVEPHNGEVPGTSESGFAVLMQLYVESSESVQSQLKRYARVM